jgi:hypothetical protein
MKILCVFYDKEPRFLDPSPEEEFQGHEVVCVDNYFEAKFLMRQAAELEKPFDIVLTDSFMPYQSNSKETEGFGGFFIMHAKLCDVKGLGLFLNPELNEVCHQEDYEDRHVFVAANKFWTLTGGRDLQKMLNTLLFRLQRIDIYLS